MQVLTLTLPSPVEGEGGQSPLPRRERDRVRGIRSMMRDLLWSAKSVAVMLVLSACAYTQPLKPTDHTAVVRAGQWGEVYRGGYVEIVSVSSVESTFRLRSDMEIPAGEQTGLFNVYLCNGGSTQCHDSIAQAQFAFRAEAGHIYRPRAREQVNGSNQFWVWLVDEANGSVAGGTPPGSGS